MLLGATLLRDLRQPEYIHVLLNPLPVYGLLIGLIGLVLALILKSRRAQIATLALVFISSASAWPVYEFGQQGYDRVLSMTDEDGGAWLDEHMHRAEGLIWIFYVLAALSAIAIAAQIKWPRSSLPLALALTRPFGLCRLAYRFMLTRSERISSLAVMMRALAWKPRCAVMRFVNSAARSTLLISTAPPDIVPRPPLPAAPISGLDSGLRTADPNCGRAQRPPPDVDPEPMSGPAAT